MNKVDRHNARVKGFAVIYDSEATAAQRIFDNALVRAEQKFRQAVETSRRQMENEPND